MQFIDTATLSLASLGAVKPMEIYVPLWFSNVLGVSSPTTANNFLQDGTNTTTTATTGSAVKLYTHSSDWPSGTKFAFEATIWAASTGTGSASLYDITVGTSLGVISTTVTTATVIRSGQFALVPGRQYAVAVSCSNSSYPGYITDASLIVFP